MRWPSTLLWLELLRPSPAICGCAPPGHRQKLTGWPTAPAPEVASRCRAMYPAQVHRQRFRTDHEARDLANAHCNLSAGAARPRRSTLHGRHRVRPDNSADCYYQDDCREVYPTPGTWIAIEQRRSLSIYSPGSTRDAAV